MFTTFIRSAPVFARTVQRRVFSSSNGNSGALIPSAVTAGVGAAAVYYLSGQTEATEKKLLGTEKKLRGTIDDLQGKIDDLQVSLSGKTNRCVSMTTIKFRTMAVTRIHKCVRVYKMNLQLDAVRSCLSNRTLARALQER